MGLIKGDKGHSLFQLEGAFGQQEATLRGLNFLGGQQPVGLVHLP